MFRGADFKEPSAGTCGRKCGAESPLCFYLLALSVYDQFRVTLEINVFITTPTSMPSASAHHPPPAESPFSHGYRARLRRKKKVPLIIFEMLVSFNLRNASAQEKSYFLAPLKAYELSLLPTQPQLVTLNKC